MTITSDTPAPEISKICTLPPAPAPPDSVASSPTVNVLPSFVIEVVESDLLVVILTIISSLTLLVPEIICPVTKVPVVVSGLISTSIISTLPSLNLVTVSTIAVAKFISSSEGSFACVIVCPTNSRESFTA